MGYSVTFNYGAWQQRYPEFSAVSQPMAQDYFTEATLYWRNDGTVPVSTAAVQSMLLNMLTAHIAALNSQSQGDEFPGESKDANSPVGRISSVTQGSISLSIESGAPPSEQAAFFGQTRYGLAFWRATAAFRTGGHYIPGQLQPGGLPGAGIYNNVWNRRG